LVTGDQAMDSRGSPWSYEEWERPEPVVQADRVYPRNGSDPKQIWQKAQKVLKREGLLFGIKKGRCLEIIAVNLFKEKKPR
jgi:hypothetical protein